MKTKLATIAFRAYLAAISGRSVSNPHPTNTLESAAWNKGAISGIGVRERTRKPMFTF